MSIPSLRDAGHVMDNLSPDQNEMLDLWSDRVQEFLRVTVEQGGPAATRAKNWLNGVWLGHPLHPALTDLALGAWWTGGVLDVVGVKGTADAAITLGVLSVVPTALSGWADWADTSGEQRRMGLVHALLNSAGFTCMVGSLFARRAERRGVGVFLSMIGLGLSSFAAYVGGHLVYAMGTNVNRTAFEPTLDEFQVVASAASVESGQPVGAEASVDGAKVPLVLYKKGQSIMALSGTCTHMGGPLAEGKLVSDDCIECPWHASQFSMADGSVRQGPATVAAHVFEARINNGNVEVRRRG
ncbi:MAG: Rieske (2Fe-2S) protein [Chloroflexota bacterium]|nr:Rieske (2Fe-2S) protein [Chloroflexota bacterium]